MAVGGAAYLVAKAIKKARVVAFEDLGMEAIYEFEVEDMPVTVAVDSTGANAHQIGQILGGSKSLKRPSKGLPLSSQRGTWQKMTKVHVSCTFLIGYLSYSKL